MIILGMVCYPKFHSILFCCSTHGICVVKRHWHSVVKEVLAMQHYSVVKEVLAMQHYSVVKEVVAMQHYSVVKEALAM